MNQPLNITIDGIDYVAFPRDTVEIDAEQSADIALYDKIKAQLATGEEELIPSAFADRIIDGESPLRVWREFRGLTLQDLAERAETSRGYLSEIENNRKDGSIKVMKRIANVLKTSLDDIV